MKPTQSILDRAFRYTSAANTDIRKTFAKIRWERARAGKQPRRVQVPTLVVDRVDVASKARR